MNKESNKFLNVFNHVILKFLLIIYSFKILKSTKSKYLNYRES